MKAKIMKVTGIIALFMLGGCDSGKNTPLNTAQSAQQAAADYSKSFQATAEKDKMEATKQSKTEKKPAPSSGDIAGLPKGAVEGAKSMVDKTKEMAVKAGEIISNAVNANKTESDINANHNADAAKKETSAGTNMKEKSNMGRTETSSDMPSAQDAAKSQAPQIPKENDAAVNTQSTNQEQGQNPSTESAEIAGLPKAAVEVAKSVVAETKEMASKAGEVISNAVNSNSSSEQNGKTGADNAKMGASSNNNISKSASNASSAQSAAELQAPKMPNANEPAKNTQPTS